MVSKAVNDRQKLANDGVSWADVHGASIAAAVIARLGAECDPAPMIRKLVKELQAATKALVEGDEAHSLEVADDAEPRARRNEFGAKVARTLQDARSVIEPAYGAAGLAALGLNVVLPKEFRQLERVGKRFIELAKADGFKLPKPKREGTEVRVSVFVKELEPNFKAYQKALADVQREESEFDATLLTKNTSLATFNKVFGDFVDAMSTFARLADMSELSDKLPSLWWRASGGGDEGEEAPAGAGEGGAPTADG
jgi:hypothetical protein